MRYRICWRSKITQYEGRGQWAFVTREYAEAFAFESNEKYPDIHHWFESLAECN